MDTLRSTAHLQRELGDELFHALVNSDNTAAVRQFAETLVNPVLPTEMTVGGRVYEILSFLNEDADGEAVSGPTMVERAKEMDANLGKEDCDFLLAHKDEIPVALRGRVVFVFTKWACPGGGRMNVAAVSWVFDGWNQLWRWLVDDWDGRHRVLRRK